MYKEVLKLIYDTILKSIAHKNALKIYNITV